MKSKIEEGLATSLGLNIVMRKVDGRRAYGIIGVAYDLWEATVAATLPPFIVITPRPGVGNPSVTGIADLVLSVRRAFGRYSAYGEERARREHGGIRSQSSAEFMVAARRRDSIFRYWNGRRRMWLGSLKSEASNAIPIITMRTDASTRRGE